MNTQWFAWQARCSGLIRSHLSLVTALAVLILAGCASSSSGVDSESIRLAAVRSATLEMRAMLEDYYAGSEVLEKSWYLPKDGSAQRRGVEFLAEKFARVLVWQDAFVIGTIGSSVTAGADNCRYDCYQQQLERLFSPVLAAGGIGFEVRNTGQGGDCGDSFTNQVWCLPALAGTDVDVTHYSWEHFEAGHETEAVAAHEMFYRWSLMMERSPVPELIYTHDCANFSSRDQVLLDRYALYGADVLCMTRGLAQVGYEQGEWGEMGDPLYATSREGELPGVSESRKKSLSVMFRNWHPGPLLFQTTADALAWRYSSALLLALDWVAAEQHPQQRWPRKTAGLALPDLPPPLECPAAWCGVPAVPVCVNFEQPVFGIPGVKLLQPEGRGWVFEPGRPSRFRVPEDERDLPQCKHPDRCSGWVVPAGKPSDWLSFSLPDLQLGFIAVCCGRKRCGEDLLAAGAEFRVNGLPLNIPPEAMPDSKCVQVQKEFPAGSGPGGKRTVELGVRLPAQEKSLPPITQVFGL